MVGGVDINLAIVKAGMAWVCRKYAHGVPEYRSIVDFDQLQNSLNFAWSSPPYRRCKSCGKVVREAKISRNP
ncbi:hypothetical protein [Oryzisolibacter sp. LB2S]|uniref:hypothetical protein n=1 Tax=Alicycliphilus soli TaxID=3228789 RepID=UPI00345AB62C